MRKSALRGGNGPSVMSRTASVSFRERNLWAYDVSLSILLLSADLSGHGSMINGNALSSRATRVGRPAFRITKTSEAVCTQDAVSE
jgi:hypothetical protein